MAEPWEGLAVNPRKADTNTLRLATYNSWFAVAKGEQEKGYPECMAAYVKHTGGIPFDHVKHFMRLRTGAHHLGLKLVDGYIPVYPDVRGSVRNVHGVLQWKTSYMCCLNAPLITTSG
jgi:hypothetical protein